MVEQVNNIIEPHYKWNANPVHIKVFQQVLYGCVDATTNYVAITKYVHLALRIIAFVHEGKT